MRTKIRKFLTNFVCEKNDILIRSDIINMTCMVLGQNK